MQENKEIEMTDEDKKEFETATHCFTCGDKLRTHIRMRKKQRNTKKLETTLSFFTGKYRGCALLKASVIQTTVKTF